MRGRTNVLSFDESFINADTIEAVADESIVSGNFVKFYNAVSGGKEVDLNCDFMMALSDGRILLAGPSTDGFTGKVIILERQEDRFIQNLPAFPFDLVSIPDSNLNYNSWFLKTGTNEFICARKVYSNSSVVPLRITTCYYDVANNELNSKYIDITGNGEMSKLQDIIFHGAGSGVRNLRFVSNYQNVNLYEINGSYYCIIQYALSGQLGTYASYYSDSIVEIFKITRSGSSYSNRSYTISNWSVLGYWDDVYSNNSTLINFIYKNLSSIFIDNGFFIICEGTKLFYVLLTDFDTNDVDTFSLIDLGSSSMYSSILSDYSVFNILSFENDYLYLMVVGNGYKLYYTKIYFYNYTKSNFKYLKWEEVQILPDVRFNLYTSVARTRATMVNFCKIGSYSVKRYFLRSFNTNDDEITFLVDVDENQHGLIVYPYNILQGEIFKASISTILSSMVLNDTKFIVNKSKVLMIYNITNDYELVGSVTDETHVLNATNENYIMGVSKESGSSGDTIQCYKAKVS